MPKNAAKSRWREENRAGNSYNFFTAQGGPGWTDANDPSGSASRLARIKLPKGMTPDQAEEYVKGQDGLSFNRGGGYFEYDGPDPQERANAIRLDFVNSQNTYTPEADPEEAEETPTGNEPTIEYANVDELAALIEKAPNAGEKVKIKNQVPLVHWQAAMKRLGVMK